MTKCEKAGKLKISSKSQNVSRLEQNVTRFHKSRSDAFDIEQNVSRWLNRDTILETLIWVVCYSRQKRDTVYLNRDTIGRIYVPI